VHVASGLPLKLLAGWTANVPRTKPGEWDAFSEELSLSDIDLDLDAESAIAKDKKADYSEAFRRAPFHDIQPLTVSSKSAKFFGAEELECSFANPCPAGQRDTGNIFTPRGLKRGNKDVGFRGTEINIEGTVFHARDANVDFFTVAELFDCMARVAHAECEAEETVFVGLKLSDDGERYLVECKAL